MRHTFCGTLRNSHATMYQLLLDDEAAVFSPASIDGLVAWWDFSDPTTLFTDAGATPVSNDGDLIYQANDKSANGFNVRQLTAANRPIYKINIQNGLSIGRDTDALRSLTSQGIKNLTQAQPFTLVAVVSYNGFSGYLTGCEHDSVRALRLISGNDFFVWCGSTWVDYSFNISLDTFYVIAEIIYGAGSYHRVNGVVGNTGNPGSNSYSSKYLIVFKAKESFRGDIGELMIYDGELSSEEFSSLEIHLNSKWSVF